MDRVCGKCGGPKPGRRCKPCAAERQRQWRKTPSGVASTKRTYATKKTRPHVEVSTILCCKCGLEKAANSDNFFRNRATYTGWAADCKACRAKISKHYHRSCRYGISQKEFEDLLIRFPYCAICKVAFSGSPRIDHCHKTNKIRGLLCHHCNVMLGHARDDLRILEAAMEYLKEAACGD